MRWALIADSSCNLRDYKPKALDCVFAIAPLKIEVGGEEFVDDASLDVAELNRRVAQESSATGSACPSTGEWAELFGLADNVLAITISSQLSGSYDAAVMARNMVLDEQGSASKKICVVDSKSAGGPLEIAVVLLDRYLTTNPDASFEDISAFAEQVLRSSQVLFSLSSYENLVKNGRMPKLVGSLASTLSIRMLGTASSEGTIKIVGPTRGDKKTYKKIVESMRSDGYHGGVAYIDHVDNLAGAQKVSDAILAEWPDAEIYIVPCGGLCSYYAEQTGLIIGYEKL